MMSITEKRQIRPNNRPDLSLKRRTECHTLSKALVILSASARVAPGLLKAKAILSNTTVRRSAVDRDDLKQFSQSEKKPHF